MATRRPAKTQAGYDSRADWSREAQDTTQRRNLPSIPTGKG